MFRGLLLVAAAAGGLTGIVAILGHPRAIQVHTVGSGVAVVLVGILAWQHREQQLAMLLTAMVVATVTGIAWTRGSGGDFVVLAHLLSGAVAAVAAAVRAVSSVPAAE